jgi:hypothetical protein
VESPWRLDETEQGVCRSVSAIFASEQIRLEPEEATAMTIGLRLLSAARTTGDPDGIDCYSTMIRGQAAEVGLSERGIARLLRRETN